MKKAGFSLSDTDWEKFYTPFAVVSIMPMVKDPDSPEAMIPKFTEEEHVSDVIESLLRKIKRRGVNVLKLKEPSIYDDNILGERE